MAHIFAGVRANDSHLDVLVNTDLHLYQHICAYTQADPPLEHVHPVPMTPFQECWWQLHDGDSHQRAIPGIILLIPNRQILQGGNTRFCRPSVWPMFNFSSTLVVFNPLTHTCLSFNGPPLLPSPSITRRMQSMDIPFSMDALSTNMPALCATYSTCWYKSAHKTPLYIHPSAMSRWYNVGKISPERLSPRYSALPAPTWGSAWACSPKTSPPNISKTVVPWRYFLETLRPTLKVYHKDKPTRGK